MTLAEYVAWNRRYLEEAGILPKGKEDESESQENEDSRNHYC